MSVYLSCREKARAQVKRNRSHEIPAFSTGPQHDSQSDRKALVPHEELQGSVRYLDPFVFNIFN